MFRSKAHKITTIKVNKKILCGKDNKRKRNVNETQFFIDETIKFQLTYLYNLYIY